MRHLGLAEVIALHRLVIETSGGAHGIRDLGGLEAAIAQPRMTFGGDDLYPTLQEKAAALGFSLVRTTRSWMATSAWRMPPWRRSL